MANEVEEIDAEPLGRRQQHKVRTERALQQAALELFAQDGFDTTTTDDIAERAGVSPRTFFRYFATKESALFVGEYSWFQTFTRTFHTQPKSMSDLEAAKEVLIGLAPGMVPGRRSLKLYEQAVSSSPALRGRVQDHIAENIRHLAAAVGSRRGAAVPDEACMLFATVVLITHRRAISRWLAGPARADLGEIIADEFALLSTILRK